MVMLIKSEN